MTDDVALWKRGSTETIDLANQDAALDAHVARNGYNVVKRFTLPDTSAFAGEQAKALAEALAEVQAGRYTRIVAASTSRFERRGEKVGIGYALELDAAGGRLEVTDNPLFGDLSNPGGWHVTIAALGGDNAYSKAISVNVGRAFDRMDSDGTFRGSPPAGYSIQGGYKARYLVPDIAQAEVHREGRGNRTRRLAGDIRKSFELAATGTGTRAIGRMLGMTPWAVTELLKRPVYSTGRYEVTRQRDGARSYHVCEPLVSPELQASAIAAMDSRRTGDNVSSRATRAADLSGGVFCPCGYAHPNTGTGMRRYFGNGRKRADGTRSPRSRRYICDGCRKSVDADRADAEVGRIMSARAGAWWTVKFIKGDDTAAELDRVQAELDDLGRRRLPEEEEDAERERLRAERKRLRDAGPGTARKVFHNTGRTMGQWWDGLAEDARRDELVAGREDFKVFVRAAGDRSGRVAAELVTYRDVQGPNRAAA